MNCRSVLYGFFLFILLSGHVSRVEPAAFQGEAALAEAALAEAALAEAALAQDEQALKLAGIALDTPSLLDYFRRRTPSAEEQQELKQRVAQLGSESYQVRVRATEHLIRAGRISLPYLRRSLTHKDAETARRAQHCIQLIEQNTRRGLSAVVGRVLAQRREPAAAGVLLAYFPFIEDTSLEEDLRQSLKRLALSPNPRGKAIAPLENALEDPETKRRGAAAWIVGQSDDAQQRQKVLPHLQDAEIEVRFLAASALLSSREASAVPALIRLLTEAPAELAWRCEDLLFRLAGEAGPSLWLDSSNDSNARKVRAAWESWWKSHETRLDWNNLHGNEQSSGLSLIVENQRADGNGRIYECNPLGQVRWQIRSQNPIDAQWLPGGRLLVADSRASLVYEVDVRGNIGWKHTGLSPTSCQRLPNGNTVISTYQSIVEFTRAGNIVFTYPTQGHTYHARKLADGHYVWIDACGEIGEIDSKGNLLGKARVGGGLAWGSIERLRNGHFLVALGGLNKVQEMDFQGKIYWEKDVNNPNRAIRLANDHVLVSSHGDQCLYEFDLQGNQRWKHACAGRPFAAQRR